MHPILLLDRAPWIRGSPAAKIAKSLFTSRQSRPAAHEDIIQPRQAHSRRRRLPFAKNRAAQPVAKSSAAVGSGTAAGSTSTNVRLQSAPSPGVHSVGASKPAIQNGVEGELGLVANAAMSWNSPLALQGSVLKEETVNTSQPVRVPIKFTDVLKVICIEIGRLESGNSPRYIRRAEELLRMPNNVSNAICLDPAEVVLFSRTSC